MTMTMTNDPMSNPRTMRVTRPTTEMGRQPAAKKGRGRTKREEEEAERDRPKLKITLDDLLDVGVAVRGLVLVRRLSAPGQVNVWCLAGTRTRTRTRKVDTSTSDKAGRECVSALDARVDGVFWARLRPGGC